MKLFPETPRSMTLWPWPWPCVLIIAILNKKLTLFITLESYKMGRSYLVSILYRWNFFQLTPRWWPCDLNRDLRSKNSYFEIVATGASVSHNYILLWISCVHMLKKWRNIMKLLYFTSFALECTIFHCDIIHCMHVHYTSNFPTFKSRYGWNTAKATLILNTTNQPTSKNGFISQN